MKVLGLIGLGIAIWGLGLVWTEINLILTPSVMIGLVLGLGTAVVVYSLSQHHGHQAANHAGHNHSTRPVPVVQMR